MLVLTATPIPRTLVLTYFGDMDISELREKPAGRQPIDTRTIPLARLDEVEDAVGRAIAAGSRAYWVCPLVEESEKIDLAAAEERYEELRKRFGDTVDLVHGRMKGAEKDAAMARFAAGESAAPGRHHGDRGRRRRAGSDRHGDRARRALRPGADPPVARPRRPRLRQVDLSPALPHAARRNRQGAARHPARDRGRLPHRRGRFAAARRRRRARHAAERHCPASASRARKCTANISAPRATMPR